MLRSIACVLAVPLATSAEGQGEEVPSDFVLVVEYAAPLFHWKTTIKADGDVLQVWGSPEVLEKTGKEESQKQMKITANDVKALFEKVKNAEISALPPEISRGGEDSLWHRLAVTSDKKTYASYSTGPSPGDQRENRFYSVFGAVLRLVPSPFPHQDAARYTPGAAAARP